MRKRVESAVKQTIDGPKPKVCAGNEAQEIHGLEHIRTTPRSFLLFVHPCNHEFQVKVYCICGYEVTSLMKWTVENIIPGLGMCDFCTSCLLAQYHKYILCNCIIDPMRSCEAQRKQILT